MVENTDPTESEAALQRRYRKLIENISDTVTVVDAEGVSIWTSAAARGDLGYEAEFWGQADLFGLAHPDDRAAIEQGLVDILRATGVVVDGEARLRRPDGTYRHVAYRAVNRLDDPDISGIVITARPIDAEILVRQERIERQAELEAALTHRAQFIADVSHEMRSPLHAIVGLTEIIVSSDELAPALRRQLQSIEREARALRLMLDELLDFSKISANRIELRSEPFSPGAVMDAVGASHGSTARERGLDFRVAIDPSLPLVLLGDEHRLRQVMVNLVSNAIKYTDTGSIELSARYDRDGRLELAVADTGPGIPEAAWPTLFEPYLQARARDSTKGTGLGLVITKRLVELMDGELHFDTSPAGTVFRVRVALGEGRRRSDRLAVRGIPEAQAARGLEVLVVDDSEVNLMLASSQLERLGHNPTTVESSEACLELLSRAAFDIILMDWHMPEIDGLEATKRIRATEGSERRTPVIATTASVMAGDRETCLAAGMDDYLPKPVSLQDLARMIERWAPTDRRAISPEANKTSGVEALLNELGDEEIVKAVLATFLGELPGWRDDLTKGVETDDLPRARRAAHTLKSTALMLGATELSAQCASFESATQPDAAQSQPKLTALLGDLITELDRANERFHTMHREFGNEQTAPEPS